MQRLSRGDRTHLPHRLGHRNRQTPALHLSSLPEHHPVPPKPLHPAASRSLRSRILFSRRRVPRDPSSDPVTSPRDTQTQVSHRDHAAPAAAARSGATCPRQRGQPLRPPGSASRSRRNRNTLEVCMRGGSPSSPPRRSTRGGRPGRGRYLML